MTLREKLKKDQTTALRNQDTLRLTVLRSLNAALLHAETSGKTRVELSEKEVEQVLRRESKKRRDSGVEYFKIGAIDHAEKEVLEAEIIDTYLPKLLSVDETRLLVGKAISESGATSLRELGVVMSVLNRVDNLDKGLASKIARELLS